MLQLRNITKSYTTAGYTQRALDGISITFRDSEFVAVLGPSGSGKTTLLNVVGGLDSYDSGELLVDGISTRSFRDRDWDAYRNNRIGFVFQSYNLIPHQNVLSNVELALTLSGVGRKERKARAKEALEKVGLAEHINKLPNQLSGGQMQRVAIARALINNPEIILADEPTGALDTKTSIQIMDVLAQISKERLVIMVTHNPELAQKYATRIVELVDGRVTGDSMPIGGAAALVRKAKQARKTSMSFLTALSLSFNNLMTKKGRTLCTALAGSIGIIGIAAILSLANGVNNYIESVEEDALSEYPLTVTSSSFDMTSMLLGVTGDAFTKPETVETNVGEVTGVRELSLVSSMFNSVGKNDLASFKEFLESGTSDIDEYVNLIDYTYNLSPQVFSSDTNDIHQVNPDSTFSSMGLGSSMSSNSLFSTMYSTDVFYKLPDDMDMVKEQYTLLAGQWPSSYDECLLVLAKDGAMSDFLSYTLGLRDWHELSDWVDQFANDEEVTVEKSKLDISYDDLLSVSFKVVNACDYYSYDEEFEVWVDKSDDENYLKKLVEDGFDLNIVGVCVLGDGRTASLLTSGIFYTPELVDHLSEEAYASEIVQEQLANPKINVFTGKNFGEEDDEDGSFDLSSLFTIDEEAISAAFNINTDALSFDLSGLSLDTSSLSLDTSALDLGDMELDLSNLDLDMSSLDIDMDTDLDLSSLDIDFAATVDTEKLSAALGLAMQDFFAWYQGQLAEGTVFDDMQSALETYASSEEVQSKLQEALSDAIDGEAIMQSVQEQLSAQIKQTIATQVVPALAASLAQQIASTMQTAVQSYMQTAVQSMLEGLTSSLASQIQSALSSAMSEMSSNFADMFSIDEEAFASAFNIDMDDDDLSDLMVALFSTTETTYESNLSTLGYVDEEALYQIDIYPIDFGAKEKVIQIIDDYNTSLEEAGKDDQVITYTDLVGTLMSSVTDIIDAISYILIAFVAISLVVSSIMIGVITYISVLERRKEIGILRALGASKGDVGRVFNAETIIEGLVAGLIGVGAVALASTPVSNMVEASFNVPNVCDLPFNAAIILVLISVALTFIAGLMPSSAASRKDPVEALRSE